MESSGLLVLSWTQVGLWFYGRSFRSYKIIKSPAIHIVYFLILTMKIESIKREPWILFVFEMRIRGKRPRAHRPGLEPTLPNNRSDGPCHCFHPLPPSKPLPLQQIHTDERAWQHQILQRHDRRRLLRPLVRLRLRPIGRSCLPIAIAIAVSVAIVGDFLRR